MTRTAYPAEISKLTPSPERLKTIRPCPRCKRPALLPPWRCCQRCEPNEVTRRESKR